MSKSDPNSERICSSVTTGGPGSCGSSALPASTSPSAAGQLNGASGWDGALSQDALQLEGRLSGVPGRLALRVMLVPAERIGHGGLQAAKEGVVTGAVCSSGLQLAHEFPPAPHGAT